MGDGAERLFCRVVMTELIDGFKVIKTQIVPKLPSLTAAPGKNDKLVFIFPIWSWAGQKSEMFLTNMV